jgi:hypothetical protein
MNKKVSKWIFPFFGFFLIAFFCLSFSLDQGQFKTNAKPPDKGKPTDCNNNGICEKGESSDCPDCIPEVYPPLVIDHVNKQIVTYSLDNITSEPRIYQYKCTGGYYVDDFNKIGDYTDTWGSDTLERYPQKSISMGDVDNDGNKEIIWVRYYYYVEGKGKNEKSWFDHKIFLYEDGSEGAPAYVSDFLGTSNECVRDSIIANVDNDAENTNELVVTFDDRIVIYKWIDSGFQEVWAGPEYGYWIYNVEVGDADNDTKNEIVLAMFEVDSVFILEHMGDNTWSDPIYTEQVTICEPIGICRIDMVRVRDVDHDGFNEIIAGGNNNRLMVWKYNIDTGIYDLVFVSEDLGGFTQGIDAGDINGDELNEIVIGASQSETFYVFDYYDDNPGDDIYGTYLLVNSYFHEDGCGDVALGDIDQDGIDEIVLSGGGLKIFDFVGIDLGSGYFNPTYNSKGIYIEIN